MKRPSHVVFATTGSLGDLHPFLAVGMEWQRRGHRASIATSAVHRQAVEAAGLGFAHMRPDPENSAAFHARYMHPRSGGEFVYRRYLGPAIRDSYADLAQAVRDADLLVSQSLMALAAPLLAASTGMPWISAVLQPMSFFSMHERPNYLGLPLLPALCERSPRLHGEVFRFVRLLTRSWLRPVLRFREELGIARRDHPMFEGQHSPSCVMAMFSPLLGRPQPDWPQAAVQTGAALYCEPGGLPSKELAGFLHERSAPLAIFTLSSAASNHAGDFYRVALAAAATLGMRALLIMGGLAAHAALPAPLPPRAMRVGYAAFEQVFPHADLVVHSGGAATCFKALMAGKPQIIVPHAHDQLDNGLRLARAGVAIVQRGQRGQSGLRRALLRVMADQDMRRRAASLAIEAAGEDGAARACDLLERRLAHA